MPINTRRASVCCVGMTKSGGQCGVGCCTLGRLGPCLAAPQPTTSGTAGMALPCSLAFTVSLLGGRGRLRAEWGSSGVALNCLALGLPLSASTWHCWSHHHDQLHGIPLCWHVCFCDGDSEGSQTFAGPSQGTLGAGGCASLEAEQSPGTQLRMWAPGTACGLSWALKEARWSLGQ